MSRFLFSALLILMVVCCEPQQNVSTGNQNPTAEPAKPKQNIVFLFFEIERNQSGTETLRLTDKKITEGFVKNSSLENKPNIPGNIAVTFLGKDGQIISERIIEDPLNPMMETYSEEGINKEKMNFPKAEFSLRFNQNGDISAVTLEKITQTSKTKLLTIKL